MRKHRLGITVLALAVFIGIGGWSLGRLAAQQTVYPVSPPVPHGPFTNNVNAPSGAAQFFGAYFELPFVTCGATTCSWTTGRIYPDNTSPQGVLIAPGTSATLGTSLSSCAPPLFSSCEIVVTSPYQGITGTITGTFTAGEQVSQATSGAVAYALNAATGTGALYLSTVVSGTGDGTHTWTGAQSSATLASPSAAPSGPGSAVLSTNAGIAKLPGAVALAFITTSSGGAPLSLTYPYQFGTPLATPSDPSPQLLVGFCSGTVTSASTDYVFPLGGVAVACTSNTTATVGAPLPHPGVIYNLHVKDGTAPGGALTGVWTVLDNATATPVSCTITGSATTCSDTTHYWVAAAGDLLTIKDATGTVSAEAAPTVSVDFY